QAQERSEAGRVSDGQFVMTTGVRYHEGASFQE
ncbi:MAG: hypothetical protein JWR39_429, partial [Devosia sp.]|nr:hypothetical protein [Devosia sp.]